jgi:FAD:protein FMN transferase
VGKGYLIDRIITQFERHPRFLINFWGDLYGKWWWRVWLEHPDRPEEAIGIISLDGFSLACSSWSRRKWNTHHHLIDPHTQTSAHEILGTFIESDSWMLADGYATALAVMPYELACQTLDETENIEWVILASDGRCFQSSESKSELFLRGDWL